MHNSHNHNPSQPFDEGEVKRAINALWSKVCQNFATKSSVANLAAEMGKLEMGQTSQSSLVANTAAAIVVKQIRKDLDNLKGDVFDYIQKCGGFSIEICTIADKFNRPAIKDPKYNTIYLTPSVHPEQHDHWDEWMAIPTSIGNKNSFKWERLGAAKIDLSWVKQDFATVNDAMVELNKRLVKVSNTMADVLLKKAIQPLEELKNYLKSDKFLHYLADEMPKASLGHDGLMTSGMVALLQGLALWAGNDHRTLGGGALSAEYVIRCMEYYGINCDELKAVEGGDKVIYPEFNFPKV